MPLKQLDWENNVNDSTPHHANSKMRMIVHDKVPYLCLFAFVEGIAAGTELR